MTRSSVDKLLDSITVAGVDYAHVVKPWGAMNELTIRDPGRPKDDLLMKEITVHEGHRTSLQYHEHKDEVIVILDGHGQVECGDAVFIGQGNVIRITPWTPHRVTGPLRYLEFSTNFPNDVVRMKDDYGRSDDV